MEFIFLLNFLPTTFEHTTTYMQTSMSWGLGVIPRIRGTMHPPENQNVPKKHPPKGPQKTEMLLFYP